MIEILGVLLLLGAVGIAIGALIVIGGILKLAFKIAFMPLILLAVIMKLGFVVLVMTIVVAFVLPALILFTVVALPFVIAGALF